MGIEEEAVLARRGEISCNLISGGRWREISFKISLKGCHRWSTVLIIPSGVKLTLLTTLIISKHNFQEFTKTEMNK